MKKRKKVDANVLLGYCERIQQVVATMTSRVVAILCIESLFISAMITVTLFNQSSLLLALSRMKFTIIIKM